MPAFPKPEEVIDGSYVMDVVKKTNTSLAVADHYKFDKSTTLHEVVGKRKYQIQFATGSAKIANGQETVLENLKDELAVASALKVVIHGHTDNKGRWVHYNPLTRAYATFQNSVTPNEFEGMTWSWAHETMKTYVKGPKKGESYKGKLGSEWHPISTWDNYPGGMRAWIELLDRPSIQPEMGDPLGGLFIMPEPWTRSGREIEDLMDELTWIETTIPSAVVTINEMLKEGEQLGFIRRELSVEFPRNTSSCYRYGGMCPNEGVCFGSLSLTPEDLIGVGKPWRLRKGHHDAEIGEGGE